MRFENDEEFDEFIDEIAEDVEGIESDINDKVVHQHLKTSLHQKESKKTKKNDVASDRRDR